MFLIPLFIARSVYANSFNVFANSSLVSIRVTGTLCDRIIVETNISNKIPGNFPTVFKPEGLNFSVRSETLFISYDARVSEESLIKLASIEEISKPSEDEWLKIIELLIVFASGLIFLILEAFSLKAKNKENTSANNCEKSKKGSVIDEEDLMKLSSVSPEEYGKIVNMVLRGELKIKKNRLRKVFSKIRKFVIFRKILLF